MECLKFVCVLLFFTFVSARRRISSQLGCKDDDEQNVDWFVNYKIPKIEKGFPGTLLSQGTAYTYITSKRPGNWTMSSISIKSESSMVANTLKPVFKKKKNTTYLFYNDEVPEFYSGSTSGHLKGVVAFDDKTGFWLIHSIPKFSSLEKYEYPSNAISNGQSIMCVTFKTTSLNEISKQLLYSRPKIYDRFLTSKVKDLLDENSQTIFSSKPAFVKKPPFVRKVTLKSLDNRVFLSFSKSDKQRYDIYSGFIAPSLETALVAETWRKGSGTYLPPACDFQYPVINIASLIMKTSNSKDEVFFKTTEDHSKWAVSMLNTDNWVCVGDLNRMESQEKRGGGALCFQSTPVANAYRSIIYTTDNCPI